MHRQTHICSVTSSVLLSVEQMRGPARQLVACDDFLWALYGGSSWVHPGLGDRNKTCEQERQKCTRSVHVHQCRYTCTCACVSRQWETFAAPIMFPEKGKGKKEHYLKMPSLDIPLPYHLELQSTLTQADAERKLLHILLQNKLTFSMTSSISLMPCHARKCSHNI